MKTPYFNFWLFGLVPLEFMLLMTGVYGSTWEQFGTFAFKTFMSDSGVVGVVRRNLLPSGQKVTCKISTYIGYVDPKNIEKIGGGAALFNFLAGGIISPVVNISITDHAYKFQDISGEVWCEAPSGAIRYRGRINAKKTN